MIKCKNPTGVYVVARDGRLIAHPVHVAPASRFDPETGEHVRIEGEWPSQLTIEKSLKPGWRFATAAEVDEAMKAAAKEDGGTASRAAFAKRAAK